MSQRSRFFDAVAANLPAITGSAATDILTSTAHGLQIGQSIIFTALTGGAGLSTGVLYFVTANSFTANTFKLSATQGGADINFTTDITAATANTGDRVYASDAWSQVFGALIGDGVVSGGNELAVSEQSPTAMGVRVNTGKAFVQGYYFEVYSAQEPLAIAASNPSNPRIDRVVVRRDLPNRTAVLAVLTGTPAASPVAPALTQNVSGVYEISLAQVLVPAAAVQIVNANITDERGARAQGTDIAAILKGTGAHAHAGTDGSGTKVDWANLASKPSTFAASDHDHIGTGSGHAGTILWTSIGSKPSTFTPEAHAHAGVGNDGGVISHDILSGVSADDHHAKSHGHTGADGSGTVDWANLTGKPSTFAPSAHATNHKTGGSDVIKASEILGLDAYATSSTVGDHIYVGTATPSSPAPIEGDLWVKA